MLDIALDCLLAATSLVMFQRRQACLTSACQKAGHNFWLNSAFDKLARTLAKKNEFTAAIQVVTTVMHLSGQRDEDDYYHQRDKKLLRNLRERAGETDVDGSYRIILQDHPTGSSYRIILQDHPTG